MTRLRSAHWCLAALLASATLFPVQATFSFYGYQRTTGWDDTGGAITVYQKQYLGGAQLEVSEVSVTARGAYLDVVEDAWISGNLGDYQYPNMTSHFALSGTFSLPANASVTGAQTWRYDIPYRSQLYPAEYIYNQSALDSNRLADMLNSQIVLLRRLDQSTYELTLSQVDVGERKHVRIRYLMPNAGGGQASYNVPILFDSWYGQRPRFTKVTFNGASTLPRHLLQTASGPVDLTDSSTHMAPYQSSLTIQVADTVYSSVHRTRFDDGAWQGTYLLLNTSMPDSVLKALWKPMEMSFVWRWNAPQDFLTLASGRKALTSNAYMVIEQARTILNLIDSLNATGQRAGLVHSVEGKPITVFAPADSGTPSQTALRSYLGKFTEQYMFETYRNEPDDPPAWAPVQSATPADLHAAQVEFLQALRAAASGLSDTAALRHVVLYSVGSGVESNTGVTQSEVSDILGLITYFYQWNVGWRGVSLSSVMPLAYGNGMTWWNGIMVPPYQPATVQLTLYNGTTPYTFPISAGAQSTFTIIMHTSTPWDSVLHWTGYDPQGHPTASAASIPLLYTTAQDSGLAKLWAADGGHLAEREVDNPGGVFGFVTKSMFLRAGLYDTTSDSSHGVPFLNGSEIHVPVAVYAPRQVTKRAQPAVKVAEFHLTQGVLQVRLPASVAARTLEVYDLGGRLLLSLDLISYRIGAGEYRIPLADLLKGRAGGMLLVRVESAGTCYTYTVNMGGAR